jgi:hypothetical protein
MVGQGTTVTGVAEQAANAIAPAIDTAPAVEALPAHAQAAAAAFPLCHLWQGRTGQSCNQVDVVRPSLSDRIKADHPDLPADGYIGNEDLDGFRSRYVSQRQPVLHLLPLLAHHDDWRRRTITASTSRPN